MFAAGAGRQELEGAADACALRAGARARLHRRRRRRRRRDGRPSTGRARRHARTHEGSAGSSGAAFATSGSPRAPDGSRGSATAERSSLGSSPLPTTSRISSRTSWTNRRQPRSDATSASSATALGSRCRWRSVASAEQRVCTHWSPTSCSSGPSWRIPIESSTSSCLTSRSPLVVHAARAGPRTTAASRPRRSASSAACTARIVVRRAAQAIPLGSSRATRRGGLVVSFGPRGTRVDAWPGSMARPGARHLYGQVIATQSRRSSVEALDSPQTASGRARRSERLERQPSARAAAVRRGRTGRSGRSSTRRSGAQGHGSSERAGRSRHATRSVCKALNDALRAAFDAPGQAGFSRGSRPADRAPVEDRTGTPSPAAAPPTAPCRGSRRRGDAVQAVADPHAPGRSSVRSRFCSTRSRVPAGTPIEVAADPGLSVSLWRHEVPEPGARGWARV